MSFLDFEFEVQGGKKRLDLALKEFVATSSEHELLRVKDGLTRNKLSKLISQGFVRVDDEVVTKAGFNVSEGDVVQVSVAVGVLLSSVILPDNDVQLDIIYEDDDLLVLNKQAGVIVHPGTGGELKTLAHGLVAYLGESILEVGHPVRPGIVHRLDKETSGLMVVAKTISSYQKLTAMFLPPRQISRKYIALVTSVPKRDGGSGGDRSGCMGCGDTNGTIDLPISRHPTQRTKMIAGRSAGSVNVGGKNVASRNIGSKDVGSAISSGVGSARQAVTHWRVVSKLKFGYVLELELETGRTHQIRAHLQAKNSHIFGDDTYGFSLATVPSEFRSVVKKVDRVALHARELFFKHPTNGKEMRFVVDAPSDMQDVMVALGV